MDDNEVEIRVTIRDDTAAGEARVRARVKRMGNDLERDSETHGRKAGRGFFSKFAESMKGDGGSMASGLASRLVSSFAGAFQLSAKTLATGFSFQFTSSVAAALAQGAAKMVHGLAAIGALLPAIAATGVVAFGTIKLAMAGVGDTLKAGLAGDTKKFEEGLKGLAPPARAFAHEVVGMRDQLTGLKNLVQGNFFTEFSGETTKLGKTFLPMVRTELGGVATSFGFAVQNAAGFLRTPRAVLMIRTALANMGQTITNVTQGLGGLVQAFVPLVAVGSTFLPRLTAGFGDAADRLGLFTQRAAETGRLADFIQRGLDKLRSLGDTASRVWNIAKNLWSVFQKLGGFGTILSQLGVKQGGLLTQLEDLSDRAAKFFNTSAGGKAMADAISTIRELLNASMGMFAKLVGIIAPFAPQIAAFATAVQNLMTAIVEAVKPAVQVLLGKLLPALTKVVEYITHNGPLLQAILIALFTAWAVHAGIAAAATIAATWPLILLGAAVAGLAYLVIVHFGTIQKVISGVWNWVHDHWPLLAAILGGPIGIAVAVIASHWEKVKAGFRALKSWIALAAGGMWGPLFTGLATVVEKIASKIHEILQLVGLLPGQGGGTANVNGVFQKANVSVPGASSGGGGGGPYQHKAHGGIGGGWTEVGERMREFAKYPGGGPRGTLVDLPSGSTVYPSGAAAGRAMGGGGAPTVNVTINVAGSIRSDRELVEMIDREIRKGGFGGLGI